MDASFKKQGAVTGDLRLLAYVQHMAQTARSEPARRAFELFLQQEKDRLHERCQESGR